MSSDRRRFISAVHLFLIDGSEILLLLRRNTGYADGQFSVIAGHLDGGETIREAAQREAREEAGISIEREQIRVVGVMHRKLSDHERIDFFLACSDWSGEIQNREPDKCAELGWFDFEDLPDNTVPYVRSAIENYRSGEWFTEFGWDST